VRTIRIILVLSTLLASVSPAAATPDSVATARLAHQLREAHYARIGIDAKTVVLVKPRIAAEGLAYESVQGESIPSHPNPVPWDRIDQIEAGTRNRRKGALIGGSLGLLTGLAVSGAANAVGKEPWGYAALFGAGGAGIGAMLSTTKWKQLVPEPLATNPAPIQIDRLEEQTALLDRQLRWAHYTRIDTEGHTFELVNPRVGAEGLAYERIPGYPKQRPAVVAGADWDSISMPSNPIPWSQIDRIETGYPRGTHGARNGALIGLLVGVVTAVAVSQADLDPYSYAPLGAALFLVWSPILGAFVGSGFHTTRWEQVYPGSNREKR
jgi:hypothetical protein